MTIAIILFYIVDLICIITGLVSIVNGYDYEDDSMLISGSLLAIVGFTVGLLLILM